MLSKIGKITPAGTITEYSILRATIQLEGITAGPDGNLWFVENNGNKIGKITPAGTITEYDLPSARWPVSITAGPDGNLWFTEQAGNIGKITTSGTITEYAIPTGGSSPYGIAAGPDGNLWFAEGIGKIGKASGQAPATHYSVNAPATATAGTAFSFTVTALDDSNATVSGYSGTVHFSSNSTAVLPADAKLTNGTGTFAATFATAGIRTITATDTVTVTITGTSNNIAVNEPNYKAKLLPDGILFASIQHAYASIPSGNITILAQVWSFPEALLFGNDTAVTLTGGMDGNFNPTPGYATVESLAVEKGSAVIGDIIIK